MVPVEQTMRAFRGMGLEECEAFYEVMDAVCNSFVDAYVHFGRGATAELLENFVHQVTHLSPHLLDPLPKFRFGFRFFSFFRFDVQNSLRIGFLVLFRLKTSLLRPRDSTLAHGSVIFSGCM